MNNVFAAGGEGGTELAKLVVDTIEKKPSTPLKYIYEDDEPIRSKIKKVSEQIYGAASVVYTTLADKKIKQIEVSESPTIRSASPRRSIRSLPIRKPTG